MSLTSVIFAALLAQGAIVTTPRTAAPAPLAQPAAPASPPAGAPAPMDCTGGFDAQIQRISRIPGILHRQPDAANPFMMVRDDAERAIYFITVPGQPAHPSIVRLVQAAGPNGQITSSGCAFGDPSESQQLMTMIQDWLRSSRAPGQAAASGPPTGAAPTPAADQASRLRGSGQ